MCGSSGVRHLTGGMTGLSGKSLQLGVSHKAFRWPLYMIQIRARGVAALGMGCIRFCPKHLQSCGSCRVFVIFFHQKQESVSNRRLGNVHNAQYVGPLQRACCRPALTWRSSVYETKVRNCRRTVGSTVSSSSSSSIP